MNDRGFAEDQPIQLDVGAHSITASYTAAANSSYNSQSSSNTLSVTITQATTTTTVTPSTLSITSGGSITLTAKVTSTSNSAARAHGHRAISERLDESWCCSDLHSYAVRSEHRNRRALYGHVDHDSVGIAAGLLCSTATAELSFAGDSLDCCAACSDELRLAMIVATRRKQYAYAGLVLMLIAASSIAGCSGGSSNSGGGGGGGGSSRSISAKYSGDTNYAASTSAAVTVTVS